MKGGKGRLINVLYKAYKVDKVDIRYEKSDQKAWKFVIGGAEGEKLKEMQEDDKEIKIR